ncbi:Ycf66 family protein, partial [Prochlorococcus marinus]
MVNASLNWASIVGIALAICGGGLYFLRSFKPALARDYDVFFAAIGLLCGGILFFQGWRLDPILQFGQFLLAGTTVFFAYESVRLRGIATDQARRSSYFDEEFESPSRPNSGFRSRDEGRFDQFQELEPISRRFGSRDSAGYETDEDELYRSSRASRPAIPEQAASRRSRPQRDSFKSESRESRRMARFSNDNPDDEIVGRSSFGDRRTYRQEDKRGSRPRANSQASRGISDSRQGRSTMSRDQSKFQSQSNRYSAPKGTPISDKAEDAAFASPESQSVRRRSTQSGPSDRRRSVGTPERSSTSRRPNSNNSMPRDNSSRRPNSNNSMPRNNSSRRPNSNNSMPRDNSS